MTKVHYLNYLTFTYSCSQNNTINNSPLSSSYCQQARSTSHKIVSINIVTRYISWNDDGQHPLCKNSQPQVPTGWFQYNGSWGNKSQPQQTPPPPSLDIKTHHEQRCEWVCRVQRVNPFHANGTSGVAHPHPAVASSLRGTRPPFDTKRRRRLRARVLGKNMKEM